MADASAHARARRARRATIAASLRSQHLQVERRLAARTLALYGEALRRLQRAPTRGRAAALRRRSAPRAPLGGAAARPGPGAAQHRASCCRPGAASTAGWAGDGRVAANPVDGVRAPQGRRSRCRRRCRSTRRWRWPTHRDAAARDPRAGARATTASSSCCTAAACASASWSASTCRRRAVRPAGSTPADASAHVLGKGSKRRSVPVGAPALRGAARAGWRCAAASRGAGEPALFVSQPRHAADRQPGALAAEGAARIAGRRCRRTCIRTCCATRSRRTCCSPAATCARCRSCSATPTSPPRRSTPSSTSAPGEGVRRRASARCGASQRPSAARGVR